MEIGSLLGIGLIGYIMNQAEKEKRFKNQNNTPLKNYVESHPRNYGQQRACADSYPVYSPDYVKHQQALVQGLGTEYDTVKENFMQQQDHQDFLPFNDPTNDLLLDLKERPIADFYHNNMVPFFGSEVKQNMAGTGVSSGNYIDGIDVNSGFDETTPNQTLLATYTGMDDTYMHKREVGPMFSPAEQQTGWVYGMPLFRPDMDRVTEGLSKFRNDLQPLESVQVGPGLNLDPTIPASGGFHEFTRILPNNVSDYKANQLEGRVNGGKYYSAGLPTSYPGIGTSGQDRAPGIPKNRPNSFWDQSRVPTMTTRVGFQTNLEFYPSDYTSDFRPNNATRDQTSFGLGNMSSEMYKQGITSEHFGNDVDIPCVDEDISIGQGPLGLHISQGSLRNNTFMSMDNNIRSRADCNSLPLGGPARPGLGQGNVMANYYVNQTDRGTVAPTNIEQINLNREGQGATFWTYEDLPGTTNKETTQFAYSSNPSREDQGTAFWTYEDAPGVTNKQTTQFAYASNPSREDQGTTFWTYEDSVPVTRKDTTDFARNGNPTKVGDAMMSRQQYYGFEIEVED